MASLREGRRIKAWRLVSREKRWLPPTSGIIVGLGLGSWVLTLLAAVSALDRSGDLDPMPSANANARCAG